jgi:sugar phosphate permease
MTGGEGALLVLFYLAYVVNIWTSSSIEIALPLVADDPSVTVGMAELSEGLALGQVATVVGKLATGPLVGWRGAGRAFPEALCVMGVAFFLGVLALRSHAPLAALACFTALKATKAAVYTSMALATKLNFRPQLLAKAWGILSTSSRVGALAGSWLLGPLATTFGWTGPVLAVAGSLQALAALLWLQAPARPETNGGGASAAEVKGGGGFSDALGVLRRDKQLWLLFATMGLLLPVMDSSALLPLFLSQQLEISVASAAQLASAFPAGMVASTIGATLFFDSMHSKTKAIFLLLATATGAVSFAALGAVQSTSAAGLLLFLGGAGVAPAQYLVPSIYIMQSVDERNAGTVMSMMDMPGYMLSACVFKLYPNVVATGGWGMFFVILGGMIGVATVCVCTQVALEGRAPQAKTRKVKRS